MKSIGDVIANMRARMPNVATPEISTTPTGEKTRALSQAAPGGYARPDELPPEPCESCKGAGYLRKPLPLGGSEVVPCQCTLEAKEVQRWREGVAAARLGPGDLENTLAGFDDTYQPQAFALASAFAQNPDRWLVFYGVTGSGKTHLLTAIAGELIRRGRRPVYWLIPTMMRHLQDGYGDNSYSRRLDAIMAAEVLLLDEWGLERESKDRDEILFSILNHRISWRLPTAIGTNLKPHQLPPRIRSRLSDPELADGLALQPYDYRTGETVRD